MAEKAGQPPASVECQEYADFDGRDERPAKRPRLDEGPTRIGNDYENTTAQGNSRNMYGNYTNTNNTNITNNLYPQQHPTTSAVQGEAQEVTLDTAASLMEALSFEEMDERYDTISAAHSKTCQWLFDTEEYKAWQEHNDLHRHRGFLWIKGKPGAGKSTVMKVAFDHGTRTFKGDTIASFFFHARGTHLQRCAEGMYRSLLHQLLGKVPGVSTILSKLGSRLRQRNWHLERLKNMFREAVLAMGSARLTCYVDALDECKDDEAQDMIEFFEILSQSATEGNVSFRVLLSSRHYPHIMIQACLELDLDRQEGHERDIIVYTKSKLQIGNSKAAQEIKDEIHRKASGVFLWAVLVIRILNKDKAKGKVRQLKDRLKELPVDLHQLFERILQRDSFNEDDKRVVLLTFQWLLFAQRPLRREELYFAVASSMDDDKIEAWDPEEVSTKDMDRFILDSSRGLAELTKGKQPTTQFIHESVRDYLLDTGLKTLDFELSNNLAGLCHDRLKQCCHHYLSKCEPILLPTHIDGLRDFMPTSAREAEELQHLRRTSHPFLDYALVGLLFHADSAHHHNLPQDLFISAFPRHLWHRLYNLTVRYHVRRLSQGVPTVYICTLMGARNLAELTMDRLMTSSEIFEAPDEQYKSLLHAAIELRNESLDMVNMLLAHGASPFCLTKDNETLLSVAIRKGKPAIVRCFINTGIFIRDDGYYESHLHKAILRGSADILSILLETATVADYLHEDSGTAVGYARNVEREDILRLLLKHVNDDQMLLRAVERGYVGTWHYLLKCGITVNMQHIDEEVATKLATQNGHKHAVLKLLNIGTEVNAKYNENDAMLLIAAHYGVERVIHWQLSFGANVNVRDDYHRTALMIASMQGYAVVIRILLSKGANVRFTDKEGWGALHYAAGNGCERALRVLLDHGCDVDLQDDQGWTALHRAAKNGHDDTVELLLDHGADINIQTLRRRSALSMALLEARLHTVRLLLGRGARAKRVS